MREFTELADISSAHLEQHASNAVSAEAVVDSEDEEGELLGTLECERTHLAVEVMQVCICFKPLLWLYNLSFILCILCNLVCGVASGRLCASSIIESALGIIEGSNSHF